MNDTRTLAPQRQRPTTLLPVPLRAAVVAAVVTGAMLWLASARLNSDHCREGFTCLLEGLVFITVGPVIAMLAGWLLLRLLRVPQAFLVAVCTLVTAYAVASPLFVWLAELIPGWLAGALGVAALAAFWAWALMPGRGPRWVLIGFGVAAVVFLATTWWTRVDLASAREDDVAAAGVQPYLLDSDQWEVVSAARAFEAPELELIYDERDTGDRIVLSVTDVPALFDPVADCDAAFPDDLTGAAPSCAQVAGADDVWVVRYGNAVSYLGRVGDSRVVLERHQVLTDEEAVRLLGALEPVSVQEFASADTS